MTVQECARFLETHDRYLLLTHTRPDGDTLCSAGALCSALRRRGKTAWLYPNPETTEKYRTFVGAYFAPEEFTGDTIVSVDTAEAGMFPKGFSGKAELAIDHHGSNSGYAPLTLVVPDRAACGEIILDVIRELCGNVTKEEADLLYVAVATDTGCFQYMNTNAHTLRAAAELVEYGAENGRLNGMLFRSVPFRRIKLESMIYRDMRFFRDGQIAVAVVTQAMLDECGVTENDLDDLAGLAGKPEGVIVSVTIKKKTPTESKVSMRSRPPVNVSDICGTFGGGGHALAAGCHVKGDVESAVEQVVAAINEAWPV